jgi:hypothetical protein
MTGAASQIYLGSNTCHTRKKEGLYCRSVPADVVFHVSLPDLKLQRRKTVNITLFRIYFIEDFSGVTRTGLGLHRPIGSKWPSLTELRARLKMPRVFWPPSWYH